MSRQRRPVRPRAAALLSALVLSVTVVASGCLQADVDVRVGDDGSGTFQLTVVLDENLDNASGLASVSSLADLARAASTGIPDAKVEELDPRRDGEGIRLTLPFETVQDLSQALVAERPLAGRSFQLFSSFEITRAGDDWTLRAVPVPGAADQLIDGLGARGAVDIVGTPKVRMSVTLPGQLRSTNGSEIEGNTVTWKLNPQPPAELRMSTWPGDPPMLLYIVGGAAGILLLGLVLLVVAAPGRPARQGTRRRRRLGRKKAAATTTAWAPPTATPVTPPSQPFETVPPYSAHPVDAPTPASGGDTSFVPSLQPAQSQWGPSGPAGGARLGPPALPPGFAPLVETSFPDSHPPGPPPGTPGAETGGPTARANVDHREPRVPQASDPAEPPVTDQAPPGDQLG